MNRKLLCFSLIFLFTTSLLCGCKKDPVVEEVIPPDYNHITWQMDKTTTVSVTHMADGAFYVEHTDENGYKTYYELGEPSPSDNMFYYLSGQEDIPTLFLGQGDRLVYHTYTGLLRDVYFSRLEDLGYTIGIYNISDLENGRCILMANSDHVLPLCTDAGFLQEQEAETILIDEMGISLPQGYTFGVPTEAMKTVQLKDETLEFYDGLTLTTTRDIKNYVMTNFKPEAPDMKDIRYSKLTSDNLQRGILYGLEKDQSYHLEFYSGTYYTTADMKANIHMLYPREHFHTNQYDVRQGSLFEIDIPDFENGIYIVGTNLGYGKAFRFVRESEYSIDDKFDTFMFPDNVKGVISKTDSKHQLNIYGKEDDSSGRADMGEVYYETAIFNYETEPDREKYDNGVSWYYKKDDIELGRILNRHAEYFTQKEEATLTTVVELHNKKKIVRIFDFTGEEYLLPDSMTDVFLEIFEGNDYLFVTDAGLALTPRKNNYGMLALNGTLVLEKEVIVEAPLEPTTPDAPEEENQKDEVRYEELPETSEDNYVQNLIDNLLGNKLNGSSDTEVDKPEPTTTPETTAPPVEEAPTEAPEQTVESETETPSEEVAEE